MLIICDVVGWILAWILGAWTWWKYCVLRWIYSWCMWKIFVGMCKFYFMNHGKILWVWIWINLWARKIFADMEEFCGHEILAMEKFCWVWNFGHEAFFVVHGHERIFYGYFGHVGIGEKKNCWYGNFGMEWEILFFVGMWFLAGNDGLNFCIAELQESS